MTRWQGTSLTARIVLINGTLFTLGTLLLAVSPATVSARPVASEAAVLLTGLVVMLVANAVLVRATLGPLEELVTRMGGAGSDPLARVVVPDGGLARRPSLAVNDLLDRIEQAQRDAGISALAGQESERSRIAQELHDGVGQSLTAVLLELGRVHDRGAAPLDPAVGRVREAVRDSLDEVRGVARQLRPHVLEDLGLRSALAALTTDLFSGGETHVRRGILPGLPTLSEETELVIFRVAQESLTNVARHARAATVEITLATEGDQMLLTVADDGRGIPDDVDGTGIRGMHERARLLGGTLAVARRDGGGTLVSLRVPVT
jgi:two-component system, NarL family, sensor histidine kinase UhpB